MEFVTHRIDLFYNGIWSQKLRSKRGLEKNVLRREPNFIAR